MVTATADVTVTLLLGCWVPLPGSGYEVYLHGKARAPRLGGVLITQIVVHSLGWNLPDNCYVRPIAHVTADQGVQ